MICLTTTSISLSSVAVRAAFAPLGHKMIVEEPKILDEGLQQANGWADKLSGDIMVRLRDEMKKRGHDI